MTEAKPNAIRDISVEGKRNRLRVRTIDCHRLGFPTIVSVPVKVDIADLACAWPVYLKRISRAPFEGSCRWIIQSWCINLIIRQRNIEVGLRSWQFKYMYLSVARAPMRRCMHHACVCNCIQWGKKNLIAISITKCKTDLIPCICGRRTARSYWYPVRTAPCILHEN